MNKLPSKETVERLRKQYPAGTHVELVSMDDPYSKLKPGDRGVIDFFDDTGAAFVKWDNGSGLGLVYGEDHFRRVENEIKYASGADFWRDMAARHGLTEALVIGENYLNTQLKQELPKDEHKFCRELFAAMYEAAASRCDPARLVYPYPFEKANEREETGRYHAGVKRNGECARAIDAAINGSCYETYRYNLDLAAMKAIHEFGFERVNMVLAHNFRHHESDGRYSDANKRWAQGIDFRDEAFRNAWMNAHPILIEDFAIHARKLYEELGAERFALPGRAESGEVVCGYEITRSIFFDDKRGFAIGRDPDAPSPWVCWQFTTENGKRDFYWGTYTDTEKVAADNYAARTIAHMEDGAREIPNPLKAAGISSEQNLNAIDSRAPAPVSKDEMNAYGYLWPGMEPLSREDALARYDGDKEVFLLYSDNTEGAAESREDIEDHDGMFGVEKEPATAEREFAAWMAVTGSSRHNWAEDEIFRLNGRGALYYTGGEDGVYMRIGKDGTLEAGRYEGAIPHIGEAVFKPEVTRRHENFSEAFAAAMDAGGKSFLTGMFGADDRMAEYVSGRAYENPRSGKPSVLKQIREAQKAPKAPRKEKAPGKDRGGMEI